MSWKFSAGQIKQPRYASVLKGNHSITKVGAII